MKKIRLLSLTLVLLTTSIFCSSAQKIDFRFGPKVGLNLSTNSLKIDDNKVSMNPKLGFNAGMIGELGIGKYFAIQPGVLFSMKGFSSNEHYYTPKGNAYYIEIPINLMGRLDFGPTALFIQAGPSFNIGLGGKVNYTYAPGVIYNYPYFENERGVKRFNIGINAGIGVELSDAAQIQLNYNWSALKYNNNDINAKWNQGVFSVSFAWLF